MSDEQMPAAPSRHWGRRAKSNPIPRDHAARQSDITRIAFQALGRDAAIAFLNTPHAGLGGRPLALATESADGCAVVQRELARLAGRDSETS